MSWLLVLVGGVVLTVVAVVDKNLGGWGAPAWTLPGMGLLISIGFVVSWLTGGAG